MNALKKTYTDIPATIKVPEEFIHRKGEIIIIVEDEIEAKSNKSLKDFYGSIPEFPKRAGQGNYEKRESLWNTF